MNSKHYPTTVIDTSVLHITSWEEVNCTPLSMITQPFVLRIGKALL